MENEDEIRWNGRVIARGNAASLIAVLFVVAVFGAGVVVGSFM